MRKAKIICLSAFLVFVLAGCIDARTKRAANLLNVKTQVAAKEYNAAPTPGEKLKVADEYFRNAGEFTQVLDDYLQGRKPVEAAPIK